MDETYIKIEGQWKYLYRAVDRNGQTINFLLTAHRNKKAALRFFKKAVRQHGLPDKCTCSRKVRCSRSKDRLCPPPNSSIYWQPNCACQ